MAKPKKEKTEKTNEEKLEKLLADFMGETVHTAFRKGCDGPAAIKVWNDIKAMPSEQWVSAVSWMCWALAYSI